MTRFVVLALLAFIGSAHAQPALVGPCMNNVSAGCSLTAPVIAGGTYTGGAINNTPIGNLTPSTGSFSTLGATGAASLLGGGTHAGTFTGGTFSGIILGGSITGTGATITGGTFSGITLSGTIAGSPTASGTWTFNNAVKASASTANPPLMTSTGGHALFTNAGTNGNTHVASTGTGVIDLDAPTPAAGSGYILVNGTLGQSQTFTSTAGSALNHGGLSPAATWQLLNWTGTNNTGSGALNFYKITDSVIASGRQLPLFSINDIYSTGADGGRQPFQVEFDGNATSASGGAGSTVGTFTGAWAASEGGVPGTTSGTGIGLNVDVSCKTNCDYFFRLADLEHDIRLFSGKHVDIKQIENLHYALNDGAHGTLEDTALAIDGAVSIAPGTGGGNIGIGFGSAQSAFPLDPTLTGSALLAVVPNVEQNLQFAWQPYAGFGIDLRYLNASTAAFISPGFTVDGGGQLNLGPATLTYSANTATLDAPNVAEVSAVIVAGGSSYKVGGELVDSAGGQWSVATITGSAVATVTLQHAAWASSCPASPTTTFGGGTGATLTITCSVGTKGIKIVGASNALGFYGTTPIVKATPTGACAGNTGCQALRDALGNLGLINTGSITN